MTKQRRGHWSWGPEEGAKLRVLSLGAGIQSSTLLLMALKREIGPMPDVILFADTGDELPATLAYCQWLKEMTSRETNGQVAFETVTSGERLSDSLRRRASEPADGKKRFVSVPFFTGNGGQGRRQCTREFKVSPLTKRQGELLGYKPRQRIPARSCEVWIGISTDEVVRAGSAFDRWQVNRYPLLEERMSRHDCIRWLEKNGYPVPPKSACTICPYRTDLEWRWLKENDPETFAEAVLLDQMIRKSPSMRHEEFLHRSRVPLSEVDFSSLEQKGQLSMLEICEGGCGL